MNRYSTDTHKMFSLEKKKRSGFSFGDDRWSMCSLQMIYLFDILSNIWYGRLLHSDTSLHHFFFHDETIDMRFHIYLMHGIRRKKMSCHMLCNCNGCSWTFHRIGILFLLFLLLLCFTFLFEHCVDTPTGINAVEIFTLVTFFVVFVWIFFFFFIYRKRTGDTSLFCFWVLNDSIRNISHQTSDRIFVFRCCYVV